MAATSARNGAAIDGAPVQYVHAGPAARDVIIAVRSNRPQRGEPFTLRVE